MRTASSCALGGWRSGKTPPRDILERDPTHAEARKTHFQRFRGKSSRTNVLKVVLSIDGKTDGIGNDLTEQSAQHIKQGLYSRSA